MTDNNTQVNIAVLSVIDKEYCFAVLCCAIRYGLLVCNKDWRSPLLVPTSDWMKKYLEIESQHLDAQVYCCLWIEDVEKSQRSLVFNPLFVCVWLTWQISPASEILHGEEYNVMVSSAKYVGGCLVKLKPLSG